MGLQLIVPPITFNLTQNATWESINSYAAGVPSFAKGLLLRATNGNLGQNNIIGSRKTGSTSDIKSKLTGTDPAQQEIIFVGLDELGNFDLYAEDITLTDFTLYGYFDDCATYLTDFAVLPTPPPAAGADPLPTDWTVIDLTPYIGATQAIAAIVVKYDVVSATYSWGVRPNGSVDDNWERNSDYTTRIIGLGAGNTIEAWCNNANIRFALVGWITKDAVFYINKQNTIIPPEATWTDMAALPAEALGPWYYFEDTTRSNAFDRAYGARPKGSTDPDLFSLHRYSDQDASLLDANGIGQVYSEWPTVAVGHIGYFIKTASPPVALSKIGVLQYLRGATASIGFFSNEQGRIGQVFNGEGQLPPIPYPTGGTVVDAELRAALIPLIDALIAAGIIAE